MTESLGLARVGEVLDPIRTHLERVRRTLLPEPGRPKGTYMEHDAIHRRIADRDPERAKGEMANHLDRVARAACLRGEAPRLLRKLAVGVAPVLAGGDELA